ncbi:MAG: hypothetical protein ACREBA_10735 [Nitrosotalea sp.]
MTSYKHIQNKLRRTCRLKSITKSSSVGNNTAKTKIKKLPWYNLLQVSYHNTCTNCSTTQSGRQRKA